MSTTGTEEHSSEDQALVNKQGSLQALSGKNTNAFKSLSIIYAVNISHTLQWLFVVLLVNITAVCLKPYGWGWRCFFVVYSLVTWERGEQWCSISFYVNCYTLDEETCTFFVLSYSETHTGRANKNNCSLGVEVESTEEWRWHPFLNFSMPRYVHVYVCAFLLPHHWAKYASGFVISKSKHEITVISHLTEAG